MKLRVSEAAPAARPPETTAPAALRRPGTGRVWPHLGALAVIVAVAFPFMSPSSSFSVDEGAYALQARALQEGGWTYDYRAAPLDPAGDAFPLANVARSGTRAYPYVQHPAYQLLLSASSSVLGEELGLHIWSLLGTLGCALAAWLLAGEVDPRLRPWALWLAAFGPALANGFVLWAHSLSAAIAGLTLVAAVRMARRGPSVGRAGAVALGLVAGVLLRSEGLLFAGAVAAALVCVQPRTTGWRSRLVLGFVALPAGVMALVERAWVRSIAGDLYDNLQSRADGGGYLTERVTALWHDLFQASTLGIVGLAVAVGFAIVALRRWTGDSRTGLAVAAACGAALAVAQFVRDPTQPVPGLFAASPVLLIGVALVRWRQVSAGVRLIGVATALFVVAVVATEYPEGGGLQWGGRFFSPVLAPLAVLAVAGIHARLAAAPRRDKTWAAGLLAALTATGAAMSLLTVGALRQTHAEVIAAVARHPAPVSVTTTAALPRVAWSINDRVSWMVADPRALAAVLADLRAHGVPGVTVVVDDWVADDRLGDVAAVVDMRERSLENLGLKLLKVRL